MGYPDIFVFLTSSRVPCPIFRLAISTTALDLCRSWMGTINYKGHKKLPPAPVALNEEEIENFGLEDLESEEPEEPEDDIILDSEEADQEAAELEETVQTVYKGLRVDDMVKVTAKNKFFDEDAIVRRLKDGKLFLRFYTYGSMYEEWMDPGDVRKLSNIEILKGMSGPQQPITQQDFDGSNQANRGSRFGDDRGRYGDSRRNQVGTRGGGPRNRRQDRTAGRFQRDSDRNQRRNDDNWNWYKDNERRKEGGGYQDGEYELRGSRDNKNRRERRNDRWAQGDVDSQWGRTSQRQNRREGRQRRQESKPEEDWSAFVSPVSKKQPTKEETDDFFASLMTDLSNDLEIGDSRRQSSVGDSKSSSDSNGEDDFFATLMSEIEEQDTQQPSEDPISSSSDDDFFASLEEEIRESSKMTSSKPKAPSAGEELDDFFSELGSFDEPAPADGGAEDFFAGLEAELESELSMNSFSGASPDANDARVDGEASFSDDFVANIEMNAGKEVLTSRKETSKPKTSSEKHSASSVSADAASLQKLTVPVLKGMLKERGLKVSGKKAELIERLSTN